MRVDHDDIDGPHLRQALDHCLLIESLRIKGDNGALTGFVDDCTRGGQFSLAHQIDDLHTELGEIFGGGVG